MSDGTSRDTLSRIDTSFTFNVYDDSRDHPSHPVSTNLPSARISTSPSTDTTPSDIPAPVIPSTNIRARNESRKLLSHVLLQLANRNKPPSIVDSIKNPTREYAERGFGALAETLKEAVKHGIRPEIKSEKRTVPHLDDSDDENHATFSTDDTIDLMLQLKDVLTMSVAQGWQIFDDGPLLQDSLGEGEFKLSTFRRSRSSFRSGGKRSRSSSPYKGQVQVSELLSLCLSIIASIVSEDCRYRVAFPRPSRPPNALQILALNVAQFLIHSHRHDARVVSQIAFAMIPAFSTFDPQMHSRLLSFFELNVIRVVLQNLKQLQGSPLQESTAKTSDDDPFGTPNQKEPPIVSILIDEVQGEGQSSQPRLGWTQSNPTNEVQSTNNPHQSPKIYYLAFLIPPLLSAIFDSLASSERSNSDMEFSMRFTRLLKLIADSKLDTYNDLLEIVAYHGYKSRRLAIASLAKLWPKAVGHTVISSPLYTPDHHHTTPSKTLDMPHNHQFMPWYIEPNQRRISINAVNDILHDNCRSCLKPIHGFSLFCPFCMTTVHFDCYDYPEGNSQIQYSMANDPRTQRIAMCRFSCIQANGDPLHVMTSKHNHLFRPTNWFTLSLCFVCHQPLWGCIAQGLRCGLCSISLHFKCVPSLSSSMHCGNATITSNDMTISWDTLRHSCLEHFPILHSTLEELNDCSHEEIAVYCSVLRTQMQILTNGIAMGSVVVLQKGRNITHAKDHNMNNFELPKFIEFCHQLLVSGKPRCSDMTQQYMQDTNAIGSKPSIMFNWSYLEYLTAAIKASSPQTRIAPRMASGFLNVDQVHAANDVVESVPYDVVALSHIRTILQVDFTLRSDHAARFLINHLHHLSLFDRTDHKLQPFEDFSREQNVECIFPLPVGLDLSLNVETLVSSIEACLSDLDVSSNEFGFLLLTRRFWPSGLASEYGLKRLAGRVLSWILDEDDNLAIILREFVAKQRKLPGVRSDRDVQPWPPFLNVRPGPSSIASNGGDFVAARRSLLSRFALPWLLELHDLDPELYCRIVFDTCSQVAADKDLDPEAVDMLSQGSRKRDFSNRCDDLLRSIIKLCQFFVIFSAFDAVFLRWIEFVFEMDAAEKPMPSLHRLFVHENEPSQRSSGPIEPLDGSGQPDKPHASYADPLRAILSFARQSDMGLARSLSFLPMIIKSGIDISTASFKQFLSLIVPSNPNCLDHANMLVRAVTLSLWLRSLGRQDVQILFATLHSQLSSHISECLLSGRDASIALSIIRQSLAACLRIYGCERASILNSGLVSLSEVEQLPSRRKLTNRGSGVVDPVIIDPQILAALQLYIQSNVEDVSCFAAKFLNLFLTESPFMEGFEIDNFILRNGKLIALCVWTTYNIQREDVAVVRTNLLLRSLLIDSEPFQEILHACMDPSSSSVEERLLGINRLFRIVSDVTSPAFGVEGRQWRSSVIEVFYSYFCALWADPAEEIRLAVKSSSIALLPAHFEVISQCWNESLSKAPITDRIRLVGFLIQLRPHFTSWKALSWESMIDTLVEYDYDPKGVDDRFSPTNGAFNEKEKNGYHLSNADPDLAHLRVSILLLSLQMIADGIVIDSFSLMKLKVQFVQITGFSGISVIPTHSGQSFYLQFGDIAEISESSYSCIEELVHVVDAPHYVTLPYSALGIPDEQEDRTSSVLVGSVFLDTSLCILSTLRDLSSLPVLTLKSVIETLYIIIHKYDFEDRLFQHQRPLLRRAVLRTVELLSKDISYELRQLALSVAQASIKKWHTFLGATVSTILELVATEIAAQSRNSQDSLVVHGKLLIGNTLHTFCHNGLLLSLMKRPLQPDFFTVLKQVFVAPGQDTVPAANPICDPLLRDTFMRAVECDSASFQTVLRNIHAFIEVVYFQGYSSELITFTGQQLTHMARRMSDGTIEGADPSPLIHISVILIQNNKKHTKELLPYIDTVLRVALNRLLVTTSSLTQLIKAAIPHRSKPQDTTPGSIDVVNVLFEILLDGLRMKTKMLPLTVKALIESLISTEVYTSSPPSATHVHLFQNVTDDAHNYLQNHIWHEEDIEHDFKAVMATGKMLLQVANNDRKAFQRLVEPSSDKLTRHLLTIRSWNILLLVALQEGKEDWKAMLYAEFTAFTAVYSAMLRSYVHSGITSQVAATTDVNQAHIATKLWLMLANSTSTLAYGGEMFVSGVWNELWSAYEGFLEVLETEAQVGLYPTLIALASTSVADLLIYMRSLKTSLALDASAHITILNRLKLLNRGDSSSSKIARAIKSMSEPPSEIAGSILLDQIAKELVAAEKIRVVESKRLGDHGRGVGDKSRKDGRLVTA